MIDDLVERFALDSATGRWMLRPGCGGLVVLSGLSGTGKSRIVREVYRRLRAQQSLPSYWPDLTPTGGAFVGDDPEGGLSVLGFRKSVGPDSADFVWPARSVPDFLWWQIGCQRAAAGGFLDAQTLFTNELLRHREPAQVGWARAAGGKLWATFTKLLLIKAGGAVVDEARGEAMQKGLAEVFGQAVPFGGLVTRALFTIKGAAGDAVDRKLRFDTDTVLGTTTGGREDPSDVLASVVASVALPGFPAVVAVEDLHDADEQTLRLLARLTGPGFTDKVLVLATGWPEGLKSRQMDGISLSDWLESVGAQKLTVGPLDTEAVSDLVLQQFPGTAADRVAAITARWTNPLAVALVLDLFGDDEVDGDAIVADDAQIEEIPNDLAGLYDQQFKRLPVAARLAVILDVICGVDPDTAQDFTATPGLSAAWNPVDPSCVLDAAARHGHNPHGFDHDTAKEAGWLVADQNWHAPREPGLAQAGWRAMRDHKMRGSAPLVRQEAARILATTINDAALHDDGTPGLFLFDDDGDGRWRIRESQWMLLLAPALPGDPEVQAAAARAALELFRHQAQLRPQEAVREWACWAPAWEALLDPDHPDTLNARDELADAYLGAGDLDEAIPLYEQTLADRQRVLSPDHPDTLTARNNLAGAYLDAGDPARAIPLYEQTLADRQRVLSPDHPDTLTSRSNLADAYLEYLYVDLAIGLYKQTLADRQRVLGKDHRDTLNSRNRLARAYLEARDPARAIPLHEQTLKDAERIFGPDHPDTLNPRNDLAGAYLEAGDPARAIPLYEQTLKDAERIFGPDHPDTLVARGNLAAAYLDAGDPARAIPLLEQDLAEAERILGPDHPHTLTARRNLATTHHNSRDLARAIPLLEQTLTGRQRVLSADHPDTLATRDELADAYLETGDLARAIALYEQILKDAERILGPDHPHTLTSRRNLADAYLETGDLARAIPLYEQTLTDQQRVLGPDHSDTLTTRNKLAAAQRSVGDKGGANRTHRQKSIDLDD